MKKEDMLRRTKKYAIENAKLVQIIVLHAEQNQKLIFLTN